MVRDRQHLRPLRQVPPLLRRHGGDSRTSGSPIFIDNAAYGFGEDENPAGPYTGPNVPSKSPAVPDGSTVNVHIGQWA
ncbi:MAG: hypothetical protein IBJ17_11950 [Reyranella sp.]|nr:hypothetical protein [Reyranella sp.]